MAVTSNRDEVALADAMGRYADGDYPAFEAVYRVLAPVVLRCQLRWVGDREQAEDLLQETFLRVHRARARYRHGAPVGPWVLTIARRLSIDALRRRAASRTRLSRDGELPDLGGEPVEYDDGAQGVIAEVRAAIEALPEGQRLVVSMHKLEGRPLAEVAEVLGINEGAARVRAHRGYNRLRESLADFFNRED